MKIAMHNQAHKAGVREGAKLNEKGIFMLQTVKIKDQNFNIFYDSGCSDLICKKSAIDRLTQLGKATLVEPGPINISGVGDTRTVSENGIYNVSLPLGSGGEALMQGLCLNKVTGVFPTFSLKKAEKDIKNHYKKSGGDVGKLPRLPSKVGGEVDIMIGVKYLKYFPEKVYKLPNGLTLYDSFFENFDGSKGVIAGPHSSFTKEWERVGHPAYSYNVKAEVPQSQLEIVATSLGDRECFENPNQNLKPQPAPTLPTGVPIGDNVPCTHVHNRETQDQGKKISLSPVCAHTREANQCQYSSQLKSAKAKAEPPPYVPTKKRGECKFGLCNCAAQLCECKISHKYPYSWSTGSVGQPRLEVVSFFETCLSCGAGNIYLLKVPVHRWANMFIFRQVLSPLFWFLILRTFLSQGIYSSCWLGRPPSVNS